jgi:hypothetical protein
VAGYPANRISRFRERGAGGGTAGHCLFRTLSPGHGEAGEVTRFGTRLGLSSGPFDASCRDAGFLSRPTWQRFRGRSGGANPPQADTSLRVVTCTTLPTHAVAVPGAHREPSTALAPSLKRPADGSQPPTSPSSRPTEANTSSAQRDRSATLHAPIACVAFRTMGEPSACHRRAS